jgi:uncharacterized protein (DUF1697 family)
VGAPKVVSNHSRTAGEKGPSASATTAARYPRGVTITPGFSVPTVGQDRAMTDRIAFLRAVNLGRRTVPMARLRSLVADTFGVDDVRTYVNSGNVVFAATGSRSALERRLERELEREFGFEVATFVRSATELRRIVDAEPFTVRSGDTHFVTFMKSSATAGRRKALEALSNDFDTLVVRGPDVHWRMHGKSTDTKVPKKAWEKVLGVDASTSRNMNMLRKLAASFDD